MDSLVVQGCNTRELLTLQEFQGGTSTSAAVGHLVFSAVLLASRGCVTTSNDSDSACTSGLNDCIHQLLRAGLELGHLKDTHGAVPNDGLAFLDCLGILLNRLRSAVQAHEALWDTCLLCDTFFDFAILSELGGASEVHWQNDLDAKLLSLGQNVRDNLGALLIIEGAADGHAILDLQKGVCHAAADNHNVDLVKHIHDQLNFVADLGTTKNGQDRLGRSLQNLGEGAQLLAHQITGTLHFEALSNHGAVSTMSSAEGIVAVHVRQFPDGGTEGSDLVLLCLNLVSFGIHALAFFLHVESQVLQQDDAARCRVCTSCLNLGPNAVFAEDNGFAQLLLEHLCNWCHGELRNYAAIGSAKVGCQHNCLGALVQDLLDRGQGTINTLGVGDLAWIGLVLGHVEVHAHEDTLSSDINIIDGQLRHRER
mmetsp:Transcript_60295/g.95492  ORF Transcript_60295/g.95492 Transcript_60295/m.95492 type:complete len:424 (-) Transcript_60295:56-1327(-)